jgi:hypothetical protein
MIVGRASFPFGKGFHGDLADNETQMSVYIGATVVIVAHVTRRYLPFTKKFHPLSV